MNPAITQSLKSAQLIFVHSKLDDLGLTPDEFRIYCHLARRAGDESVAWPGVYSIAKICKISHNTARKALKSLHAANLIVVIRTHGQTNRYHLTDCSAWKIDGLIRDAEPVKNCLPLPNEGDPTPTKVGRGGLPTLVGDPYQSRETKVLQEGTPIRESKDSSPPKEEFSLEGERKRDDVPEELDTPEFREAFGNFEKDRKARRRPVTPNARRLLFRKMKTWGATKAVEALNNAIENSWTGIFEPQTRTGNAARSEEPEPKFYTAPPKRIISEEEKRRTSELMKRARMELMGVRA